MEQHPIPQQISSYQFKLVGDMTLVQFGKAAVGIVLAVILNTTKIVFFIKYPLMLLFGAGGLALAFVPFEDRPLETWIVSFIRSVYSPTIYVWKKKRPTNWLDIDNTKTFGGEKDEVIDVPEKNEGKVKEFIQSLPSFKRESGKNMDISGEEKTTNGDLENVANGMSESDVKNKEKVLKKKTGLDGKKIDDEGGVSLNVGKREKLTATGIAEFGGIPMPDTPTEPNVLSGMVIGPSDEIIEQAIVEVRDRNDNPVRVFKTNALGQFKTATPLLAGNYLVITEKHGYLFDRVNVAMEGKILEPIKIRAKQKVDVQTQAEA